MRIPRTARLSNQPILKETNCEYSLEGPMLKLKLQYFGHLISGKSQLTGKDPDVGRKAGYAMVTAEQGLEAKSLPQGTSAQLAELVALTRALELSKGQRANIYTDSKYAYLTLYAHAAIWKERQFKIATGGPIKHFREIERLLTDIDCSKEVAVMYFKGHSRDRS